MSVLSFPSNSILSYNSPLVPSATVSNFGILTINRTTVLLTWSPLARELQNGDITQYSLSYLSHSLKETFSLSTDQFFYYINSLNATDGYTFTLSADNSVGAGPIVVGTVTQDPGTQIHTYNLLFNYTVYSRIMRYIGYSGHILNPPAYLRTKFDAPWCSY